MSKCPKCKKEVPENSEFCNYCGAKIKKISSEKARKKTLSKKIAIGVISSIVIISVIIGTVFSLKSSKQTPIYGFYEKGSDAYFTNFSEKAPMKYSSERTETSLMLTALSNDGKMIFYCDGSNKELYYRYTDSPNSAPTKISDNVENFIISKDSLTITYVKENSGVYQYDIATKNITEICAEATQVSDSTKNGEGLVLSKDNDIYVKTAIDDKAQLIDTNIDNYYTNDDFTTVYYLKNKTLYKKDYDHEKIKIADGVDGLYGTYSSGECYFTQNSVDIEKPFSYFILDDMKEADKKATPADEYEYEQKVIRDKIRKQAKKETLYRTISTLCYYNGSEISVVSKNFSYLGHPSAGIYWKSPLFVFTDCTIPEQNSIKLSEINSIDELDSILYGSVEYSVAVGDKVTPINTNSPECINIANDGKTISYLDNVNDNRCGNLYLVKISDDGTVSAPELYTDNVLSEYRDTYFAENNDLIYIKNYNTKTELGELYINKEKISDNVGPLHNYSAENGTVAFTNSTETEYAIYNLGINKNGKTATVSDNVCDYQLFPNGNILYLKVKGANENTGSDLYFYNGKESKLIDTDVTGINYCFDTDFYYE